MNFRLIFHPLADLEYRDAFLWYENEQAGLGERFEKMIDQRLLKIIEHPENYGISKRPYREASIEFFPYTIVYKINKRKKLIYLLYLRSIIGKEIPNLNTEVNSLNPSPSSSFLSFTKAARLGPGNEMSLPLIACHNTSMNSRSGMGFFPLYRCCASALVL